MAGYLEIGAVVEAAVGTGADAIHPGYGFLSENPAFAQSVRGGGHRVRRAVGGDDQDWPATSGRRGSGCLSTACPVLPETEVALDGDADLASQAELVGYPLMVKASEGGGGIGMNLIEEPSQLERAVRRTRSSSRRAFGSQDVYLERYVPDARHVEVQIVADTDGTVTHLRERECSAQRRHQKVIEEAGSPSITEATRKRS